MRIPPHPRLALAILAGGESRRMGVDKASLTVDGAPLLERLARAGADAGLDVVVVGRACPDRWAGPPARFLPDEIPGAGPLGGLASALRATRAPVLLLACDLPRMDAATLGWLAARWTERPGEPAGLATARADRVEPLFAVYAPALLERIDARLADGRRSVTGLIAEAGLETIPVPQEMAPRLDGANSPQEWNALTGR